MANNPIFPFYVNDFEGGTRHMTDAEVGCYLRLLMAQFNRGGFLPPDENFLARFCSSFKESWPIVKEKFLKTEKGLQNKRLEKERVKRENFKNHQSENGKKGGRPKKPKPLETENPNESQNIPNEKPLGKGKGNREREGNIENGYGYQEGGVGEEKFIIPSMCEIWYQKFPLYTKDKENDFDGMGRILKFIYRQAPNPKNIAEEETRSLILGTLEVIANEVNKESFWANKPIKSISNHIQEFYNKIKNPLNGKQSGTNGKQQSNFRSEVQAERIKRREERQQART